MLWVDKIWANLFISRGDKAYICPGTATGMQSARNVKIIQPSDPSKQKVLPKYDFPERLVNATPVQLFNSSKELVAKLHANCQHSVIWDVMEDLLKSCKRNVKKLAKCLPKFKCRIHKFTDAGPGVGITNHDVNICCAEIILLTDIDYYIRHYLANCDSSQNMVERCQSYVGIAICDGEALICELNRMKFNTFKVCEELTY